MSHVKLQCVHATAQASGEGASAPEVAGAAGAGPGERKQGGLRRQVLAVQAVEDGVLLLARHNAVVDALRHHLRYHVQVAPHLHAALHSQLWHSHTLCWQE